MQGLGAQLPSTTPQGAEGIGRMPVVVVVVVRDDRRTPGPLEQ